MREVLFEVPAPEPMDSLTESLLDEEFQEKHFIVHFHFDPDGADGQLLEARFHGLPLVDTYSAQKHAAHASPGYEHLHVYSKQNHLFAMNRDGSAHDDSHGYRIPNRVAQAIRTRFPDFIIPSNNLIESFEAAQVNAIVDRLLNG
jgi:hypothetical protein